MTRKKLLLFTASYPFSIAAEDTFLNPELRRGIHRFSEIIVIPSRNEGTRNTIFRDIIVEEGFADLFARFKSDKCFMFRYILKGVARKEFYRDLWINRKRVLHLLAFLKTVWMVSAACLVEEWLSAYIASNKIDIDMTIFYTFWCNEITLGLAFVKRKHPHMKIVSRANGYDIYEEQNTPPFIPFRSQTFDALCGLYLVSKLARDYLAERFPAFADRLFFSHMGVEDPGFTTSASTDGSVRIVSCAYIVPVKRIRLMADGITAFAKRVIGTKVYWTHIGEGEQNEEMEKYVQKNAPENLTVQFAGYIPSVYDYYRTHAVDFLISTSSSEGLPVTIMEAQSCGIPVIATSVGGVPEIVSDTCGILLPPNPTPSQIADGIVTFCERTTNGKNLRQGAKENWKTNYNAETNYTQFYRHVMGVPSESGKDAGNDHP